MRKNGVFVLRTWESEDMPSTDFSGEPLERTEYQAAQAVRPLKEKELGTVGELSTSNPRREVPEAGQEAPKLVCTRSGRC